MTTRYLTTVLFAFFMAMVLNTVNAQEKKIKVIKKGDGTEDVHIINSIDELDAETLKMLEEKGIDLNDLSDVKHEKHYKIIVKDDNGESKTIEWNGEGEMPAELEEHLGDLDIDIVGDGKMMFIKAEGGELIGDEDIEVDVDVISLLNEIEGEEGEVNKQIRIKVIDDNGETIDFEWNGEGEMPEEMQSYMDMAKCGDENTFVHKIKMKDVDGGGVQLGIMIEKSEDGVMVLEAIEGTGAAAAGLQKGDVIQFLNGEEVTDLGQLVELVNNYGAGDIVKIGFDRNGNSGEVDVTLSEKKSVKVIVKKVECDLTDKEACAKACAKTCKKKCTKEQLEKCKKTCTKEEWKECLKNIEEGSTQSDFVAPRNNLKLKGFNAYPNPSNGLINIEFEGSKDPVVVQILDLNGKSIFKDVVNNFEGSYKNKIDLRDKIQGQVFVSVIQKEKIFTQQVVVN